jgi:hypothetical protein
MNSFWANLLERFGSKSAWLFVPVLLVFLAVALVGSSVGDLISIQLPPIVLNGSSFIIAVPAIGLLLAAFVLWRVRRARARRTKNLTSEQLSRDELAKARSKLRSQFKSVKPVATRAPDTDLKF